MPFNLGGVLMMCRRLGVILFLFFMCGSEVFAGDSSIIITAPTVSGTDAASIAAAASINASIASQIASKQQYLNDKYFKYYNGQNQLARGFSNANNVTANNASMLGYQNYDLFCVMVGANLGASYPSSSLKGYESAFDDVKTKGDLYTGAGTGGIAGQVGINAGFLLEDLYLSAKFGMLSYSRSIGKNDVRFDQKMFGIGANYNLVSMWDFAYGLLKWRGISLGTGLVYNANSIQLDVPIENQTYTVDGGAYGTFSGSVTDIKARMKIETQSVIVPLEAMTSVQFLWLCNLGIGAGVDLVAPRSTIKVESKANVNINSPSSSFTTAPGSARVSGTTTTNKPELYDIVSPRLMADVGFNVSVVKFDVAANWYPVARTASVGVSAGVVW